MDFNLMLQLLRALDEHEVDYVLVGAAAMSILGLVRATEDIDLFVRPDEKNIERLRQALRSIWDDPEIEAISAADLLGDYPAVRYGPPDGSLTLDILTRLGEAFHFEEIEARKIIFSGIRVCLATPRQLFEMKRATLRPQDRADAEALREAFPTEVE